MIPVFACYYNTYRENADEFTHTLYVKHLTIAGAVSVKGFEITFESIIFFNFENLEFFSSIYVSRVFFYDKTIFIEIGAVPPINHFSFSSDVLLWYTLHTPTAIRPNQFNRFNYRRLAGI